MDLKSIGLCPHRFEPCRQRMHFVIYHWWLGVKINPYTRAIRTGQSAAVQLYADSMHISTYPTLPAVGLYIATNFLFGVEYLVNQGYIYLYQYAMWQWINQNMVFQNMFWRICITVNSYSLITLQVRTGISSIRNVRSIDLSSNCCDCS